MPKYSISKIVIYSLFIICWIISFFVMISYEIMDWANIFILIFSAFSLVFVTKHKGVVNKYFGMRWRCFITLLGFYFSFALFGRPLFMNELAFAIDHLRVLSFIILSVSLCPLTYGCLYLLEFVSNKIKDNSYKQGAVKTAFLFGFIFFLILVFLSLRYYPCTMTTDSVNHWKRAVGQEELTDYWSIAYQMFLAFLFNISNAKTPYIYCLFQMALFSAVWGDIVFYFTRKGVGKRALFVATILLSVCPSSFMLTMYLSSNVLGSILVLWVTISVVELLSDPTFYGNSLIWKLKTIVAVVTTVLCRDNYFLILFPLAVFCIWVIRRKPSLIKAVTFVFACIIACFFLIKGVGYRFIDYSHVGKESQTIRPLMAPVGSAIKQHVDLPQDIIEVAERILPLSEWECRYHEFNSDPLTWGDPLPDYASVSLKDAFSTYMKMLFLHPDIVIKDRLDGSDSIWNIRGRIIRCTTWREGEVSFLDAKPFSENNIIGNAILFAIDRIDHILVSFSTENEIMDMLIWRNGIYVYFLLVIILFLIINRKMYFLWSIMPAVFILLGYVLVIAWRMYFYLWFFPLSVTLLVFVSIIECSRNLNSADVNKISGYEWMKR